MIAVKHMALQDRKIKTLSTAIFSNDSRNILKFPTCLIQVLEADKKGHVWFIAKKPFDDISDLDENCPAALQFHNKYFNYHINLFGIATIIADYKEDRETLIRFSIHTTNYYYWKKKRPISYIRMINLIINFISMNLRLCFRSVTLLHENNTCQAYNNPATRT